MGRESLAYIPGLAQCGNICLQPNLYLRTPLDQEEETEKFWWYQRWSNPVVSEVEQSLHEDPASIFGLILLLLNLSTAETN